MSSRRLTVLQAREPEVADAISAYARRIVGQVSKDTLCKCGHSLEEHVPQFGPCMRCQCLEHSRLGELLP